MNTEIQEVLELLTTDSSSLISQSRFDSCLLWINDNFSFSFGRLIPNNVTQYWEISPSELISDKLDMFHENFVGSVLLIFPTYGFGITSTADDILERMNILLSFPEEDIFVVTMVNKCCLEIYHEELLIFAKLLSGAISR